jgi:tRNA threonylcarbamoyladenosine biosynthesis protein TsaE
MERFDVPDEATMRSLGSLFAQRWGAGDVVLLEGELGAGKTTLVRGVLEGLGYEYSVRSPTFNLIQTFPTHPPVVHSDLYRVQTYEGIGLEDYLDSHLCLIEWPDRAVGLVDFDKCWRIRILFVGEGRTVEVIAP